MKFISLFTRLGLLALGFILVAAVNADDVWSNPSDTQPTTSGLADALLNEWGFALLVLGLLMAMAMMGAAYLVRDERMENLLWEFGGEEE
jgi:NADH:ubiquinone oxidoreductase subunit 6 (subunit J)